MSDSYNFPTPLATSRDEIVAEKNTQARCVFSLRHITIPLARKFGVGWLVQHGQRVRLTNQCCVEVEVKIEPAIRLRVVNGARHQKVSRVVVAF